MLMKADRIDLGLTGYDELFMSTEERLDAKKPKVDELPLDELKPFKEHPFKVMEDEEMERLKESIRESGVLIPALARPAENGYELISGHRRLAACRALGMSTMPVIVRNLTDEEAVITMVDSNLQREHILPSEKAFAYKMKMEALKSQHTQTVPRLRFHIEDGNELSRLKIQHIIRCDDILSLKFALGVDLVLHALHLLFQQFDQRARFLAGECAAIVAPLMIRRPVVNVELRFCTIPADHIQFQFPAS